MAKKEEAPKNVLERTYNVPLRKGWLRVPHYKRSKKAITELRQFLIKHMKPEEDGKGKVQLKIGKALNDFIWKHGIKNPPHHVKITATKNDKGLVMAELEGVKIEEKKVEAPKKEAKPEVKDEKKEGKSLQGSNKDETVKKEEKAELEALEKEQKEKPEEKKAPKEEKVAKPVEAKPNAPDNK